jgi:hypothetical protein
MQFMLIDPATGKTQATGSYHFEGLQCSPMPTRRRFSPDLSKYAAVQSNTADGSTRAGYNELDSGQWTAAPADPAGPSFPSSSSFGTVTRESDAVFSPTTGNLWFRSGNDILSVKPGSDAIQDRQSLPWLTAEAAAHSHCDDPVSARFNSECTPPPFLLAPGTDAPVVSDQLLPNPSGALAIGNSVLYSPEQMRAPDRGSGVGQRIALGCAPRAWITDTTLVCWVDGKGPHIADISNRANVSVVPLLPASTLVNWSFAPNLKNQNVAFLSVQGNTGNKVSLFVANVATPGAPPRKVVDLEVPNLAQNYIISGLSILDWTG